MKENILDDYNAVAERIIECNAELRGSLLHGYYSGECPEFGIMRDIVRNLCLLYPAFPYAKEYIDRFSTIEIDEIDDLLNNLSHDMIAFVESDYCPSAYKGPK